MTSAAVRWLDGKEPEAIRFLEALVNQDSGTYDALDVNRLADMLVAPLRDLGFPVNEGRPEVSIFAAHQARGAQRRTPRTSLAFTPMGSGLQARGCRANDQVSASGIVKWNVDPRPSVVSTQMRPRWSSTNLLLMASPSPVPPDSRATGLSRW
jgi:hypothetical protein